MNELFGVRIAYLGNIIYSNRFKATADNEWFAKSVLMLILGYDPWERRVGEKSEFEVFGGMIKYYKES